MTRKKKRSRKFETDCDTKPLRTLFTGRPTRFSICNSRSFTNATSTSARFHCFRLFTFFSANGRLFRLLRSLQL